MSLDGLRRRVARLERKAAEHLRDEDRTRLAKLQAKAALLGAALYPISTGGYLLLRWSMSRELDSLAEVEALLAKMGPPGGAS